jgi:hypothetical protein
MKASATFRRNTNTNIPKNLKTNTERKSLGIWAAFWRVCLRGVRRCATQGTWLILLLLLKN